MSEEKDYKRPYNNQNGGGGSPQQDSVYSQKVRAGKRRTYFFDVRRTKGEDYFMTITEVSKRMDGGFERHKIFLYKEDFNRFVESLAETVEYVKTELMPQYDYDEFARRQEEYENRMAEERAQYQAEVSENGETTDPANAEPKAERPALRIERMVPTEQAQAPKRPIVVEKIVEKAEPMPMPMPVQKEKEKIVDSTLPPLNPKKAFSEDDDDMSW